MCTMEKVCTAVKAAIDEVPFITDPVRLTEIAVEAALGNREDDEHPRDDLRTIATVYARHVSQQRTQGARFGQ